MLPVTSNFICTFLFLASILSDFNVNAQQKVTNGGALQEVIIKNNSVKRVLHSAKEYVVDYDFVAEKLLVSSYSSYKNSKVFLLDKYGDTVLIKQIPFQSNGLFKSCMGKYYCIGYDDLYPLQIDSFQITIEKPYNLSILRELQECKFATAKRFYYKIENLLQLQMLFGYQQVDDSRFHSVLNLIDVENLRSILDPHSTMSAPLRLRFLREAFAFLNQPLFFKNDSIIGFDFKTKRILFYNMDGKILSWIPLQATWENVQRIEILEDQFTGQFYFHSFQDAKNHSVASISMETGELGRPIKIEKPFPVKVKINANDIYYLWQDGASTQQLFMQKGFY